MPRLPPLYLLAGSVVGWIVLIGLRGADLENRSLCAAEPVAKAGSSLDGMSLPVDREAERALADARALVVAERYAEAAACLQLILDWPETEWSGSGPRLTDLTAVANQILTEQPAALRAEYRRQQSQPASVALTKAGIDPTSLMQVAVRYHHTAAGEEAVWRAGETWWERGAFLEAAAAFQRALDHPHPTVAPTPSRLLKAAVAWSRADDQTKAHDVLVRLAALRPDLKVDDQLLAAFRNQQRTLSVSHSPTGLPIVKPVWQHGGIASKEISLLVARAAADLRAQGLVLLPAMTPLAVGDRVLTRGPRQLAALDAATGRILWEVPLLSDLPRISDDAIELQNPAFQSLVVKQLTRATFADTLGGSLTTDGQRVYLAEAALEQAGPSSNRAQRGLQLQSAGAARIQANHLLAFDVQTGARCWSAGGLPALETPGAVPGDPLLGVFFLGPPVRHGRLLYVLGQAKSEVSLFALDPEHGKLEWHLALATAPVPIGTDYLRRLGGRPVVGVGDTLLCPVGEGTLISVDLVTNRRRWAQRYSVKAMESPGDVPVGRLGDFAGPPLSIGWQAPDLFVGGNLAVFVSPESDWIWACDIATGEIRWKRPRGDAVALVGLFDDRFCTARLRGISAWRLADGAPLWQAQIGIPAGRGVASGTQLYAPLLAGGVAAIDLETGQVVAGGIGVGEAAGNLVATSAGVVSHSARGVVLLADFTQARLAGERLAAESPEDASLRRDLADLLRKGGQPHPAALLLAEVQQQEDGPGVRRELAEAYLAELQSDPSQVAAIGPQLEALILPRDRVDPNLSPTVLYQLAVAWRRTGQPREALSSLLQLQTLAADQMLPVAGAPQILARIDRGVQAEIIGLLETATPEEAALLRQTLNDRQQQARDSRDPFALQRFADQFSHLPWGRAVRTQLPERAGIGVSFQHSELILLDLIHDADRPTSALALRRLGEAMAQRSFREDAARYYHQLSSEVGDVILPEGQSAAEFLQALDDPLLRKALDEGAVDSWPVRQPEITTRPQRNNQIYQDPVPILAVADSLGDRLHLTFDRQSRRLRFQGEKYAGAWELEVPPSRSPIRDLVQAYTAWGMGRTLIIRLGTQLLGVAPLDDAGEPHARILWAMELFDGSEVLDEYGDSFRLVQQPGPIGTGGMRTIVIDRFGRQVGAVGPVRPGYLCYRQQSRLIAVDTATGRTLWQRSELPAGAELWGDDRHLYLRIAGSAEYEILRVLDGQTIATRSFPPGELLLDLDGDLLMVQRTPDTVQVSRVSLREGRPLWTRTVPATTRQLPFGAGDISLLHEDGRLEWLDQFTGETQQTTHVMLPPKLVEVYLFHDRLRNYALLSGAAEAVDNAQLNQVRSGHRLAQANGTLHAWSRRTGELLWQRRLTDVAFNLDQPDDAPVIVLNYAQFDAPTDGSREIVSFVRCLDKRTGKDVFRERLQLRQANPNVYCALELNPDQDWVELHTAVQTVRLDYRRDGVAPEEIK